MSATGESPLTQRARTIQMQNQQFQQELTGAALEASSNPTRALVRLDQCWVQADLLERDELAFLAQMGDFGTQQTPQAKNSWRENRLQILVGKARVLMILGRYGEAQSAVDSARMYIADPAHPASSMLDELEVLIMQAKG